MSDNGVLGQSPENFQLLNLKEVAERIGCSYERLREYANVPGVREHVGAIQTGGSRGARYPASSVETFARIMADAKAGRVQPKTLGAYLEGLRYGLSQPKPPAHEMALSPDEQRELLENTRRLLALLPSQSPTDDR